MQFKAKIERWRLEADYKHKRTFTAEEAKEAYEQAKEFVSQAKKLLQ